METGDAEVEMHEGEWRGGWAVDGEWQIRFLNGDQFVGACVGGRPHGEGVLKSASGDVFTVEFRGGSRHGQGTLVARTGEVYQGLWTDGRMDTGGSEGTLQMSDGTVHHFADEEEEEGEEAAFDAPGH